MKVELPQDIIIESDETDEFLSRLENSFGMDHREMGLSNGVTLKELTQSVLKKLDRMNYDACTSQRLFYIIREFLFREQGMTIDMISPNSKLSTILPMASRRKIINKLELELGIKIRYYQAPGWMQLGIALALLISFVWLFINPILGILGITISLLTISIAHIISISLPFKTLRELIDRIKTDNLVRIQRNERSINPKEVEQVLINVLIDLHGMDKSEINFNQRIVFA